MEGEQWCDLTSDVEGFEMGNQRSALNASYAGCHLTCMLMPELTYVIEECFNVAQCDGNFACSTKHHELRGCKGVENKTMHSVRYQVALVATQSVEGTPKNLKVLNLPLFDGIHRGHAHLSPNAQA